MRKIRVLVTSQEGKTIIDEVFTTKGLTLDNALQVLIDMNLMAGYIVGITEVEGEQ